MALNGLDTPAVLEAHVNALSLPEGWFLLKYISRDEVSLLDQGAAGLDEARTSLSQYTETSPLYGFLQYRGHKILLKYIPDGTSRLLKARTVVHYQTLADNFAHDNSFEATTSNDITPQALSSACSIAEPEPRNTTQSEAVLINKENTAESSQSQIDQTDQSRAILPNDVPSTESTATKPSHPVDSATTQAFQPYTPDTGVVSATEHRDSLQTISEPLQDRIIAQDNTIQRGEFPDISGPDVDRPTSKDTNRSVRDNQDRPSTSASTASEFFKNSFYSLKPKTKLFPRPVAGDKTNKTSPAATIRQKLPNGMKSKRGEDERPKTSKSSRSEQSDANSQSISSARPKTTETMFLAQEDPIVAATPLSASRLEQKEKPSQPKVDPPLAQAPFLQPKPVSSSGSVSAVDAQLTSSSNKRSNVISPERQRLMKALQMRKMQRLNAASDLPPADGRGELDSHVSANGSPLTQARIDSGVGIEAVNGFESAEMKTTQEPAARLEPINIVQRTETPSQAIAAADTTMRSSLPLNLGKSPASAPSSRDHRESQSVPDALRTSTVSDDSNESTASDDSLAHELESATVEQATPISVARSVSQASPEASHFPSTTIDQRSNTRCVTPILITPATRGNALSRQSSSQATLDAGVQANQKTSPDQSIGGRPSLLKKSNVSSGISRRIQALAEISSRETSPSASHNHVHGPETSSLLSFRKASNQDTLSQVSSYQRPSLAGSRGSSLLSAAARSRTKLETAEAVPTLYRVSQETQTPDTVSITARIVRGPSAKDSDSQSQNNGSKVDLFRSPLIIEHQPAEQRKPGSRAGISKGEKPSSDPMRPVSRESSLTALTRQSVEMSWRLVGRGKSETISPPPPPKSARSMSSTSLDPVEESNEEKRESRTSRLLKRMSGLSAGSKKRPATTDSVTPSLSMKSYALKAAVVGDLNVQLPDTLLWKWRWVEIDTFGNLVVSAARSNERAKSVPRKYHLSEFRTPVIPTLDRQELPHSVILEFINGGTLQFACEDTIAQAQVFKRLLDTHHAWLSLER